MYLQVKGAGARCLGSAWSQTALQASLAAAVPDLLSVQLRSLTAGTESSATAAFGVATSHMPGRLSAQVLKSFGFPFIEVASVHLGNNS